MKKQITIVLMVTLALALNVMAENAKSNKVKKEVIAQKICPVMGGKINKNLYYEYKGHKIYVCCQGCIATVKKDPEKYLKKVQANIAKNAVVKQTICPVMGGKINKNLYYEYKGHKIYVCCQGCIAAVKKNPEKYLKKVQADIAKAATASADTK